MPTNINKKTNVPKHGFISELAAIVGCNRNTVRRALYENARGVKAEKVRQIYRLKYEKQEKSPESNFMQ